jgi:hypothetical protein
LLLDIFLILHICDFENIIYGSFVRPIELNKLGIWLKVMKIIEASTCKGITQTLIPTD